jgi:hypothetical protein
MNKKFEYVDDNPGAYFSMLVESFEEKKELKESVVGNAKNWLIDKEGKSPKEAEKIINSLSPEEIEKIALKWLKQRKLKEDKFVPQDKMSKKAQKELNDKKRGAWGNTSPVTKVQPNKKAYDRKRDKKAIEESKNGNKVYIAIGLEKGKEPKILGVYDSKEKANEQYKDSKMWVNISEQTVK